MVHFAVLDLTVLGDEILQPGADLALTEETSGAILLSAIEQDMLLTDRRSTVL